MLSNLLWLENVLRKEKPPEGGVLPTTRKVHHFIVRRHTLKLTSNEFVRYPLGR